MQLLPVLLTLGWAACAAQQIIPNSYIVVFKDTPECKATDPADLEQKARGLIGTALAVLNVAGQLLFVYPRLNGFAARGVSKSLLELNPCVAYTEADQVVQLPPTEQRRSLRGLQTTVGVSCLAISFRVPV